MSQIAERLAARNSSTRSAWHAYASHRERVMAILRGFDLDADTSTLCLIGAGNCNDVDLRELSKHYGRVQLVDLDEPAMRAAIERQLGANPAAYANVVIHDPIDVSGILAPGEPIDPADMAATAAEAPVLITDSPVDVVASLCVLTQLIDSVVISMGPDHPQVDAAVLATRDRHLSLLGELAGVRGRAVLVTDFVSSDTAPEILAPDLDGMALMKRLIAGGNFVTGTNPAAVEGACRRIPAPLQVERFVSPWVWDLGIRAYLTYALVLRRTRHIV